MCPARCDASCGRCAGANSRPANSSGERTSTRFLLPIAATTSSRNARIEVSWSCAVYWVAGRWVVSSVSGAGVELPLLAAAVEQLDVPVPVELEVPVGVRGEPVVVAAVEDHGVVGGDALGREQLLEAGLVDEVAPHRVLQLGLPVELHRAGDVALVVCAGVFVDLDEDDAGLTEILLGPVGSDEHVRSAHAGDLLSGLECTGVACRAHWRRASQRAAGAGWSERARETSAHATQAAAHAAQVDRAALGEQGAHGRSG